mmetsp:Transcript_73172/g.193045  ORF Transcript_73172/g.193045 Transcript_73172/m.193045 type:complete len:258 (+) Transcript_73172:3-776(+)
MRLREVELAPAPFARSQSEGWGAVAAAAAQFARSRTEAASGAAASAGADRPSAAKAASRIAPVEEEVHAQRFDLSPCKSFAIAEYHPSQDPSSAAFERDSNSAGSVVGSVDAESVTEEDIEELQQIVESMEDWKDLKRYSGKSISMASTQRGNEMKIHVLAFAERDDGGGVDFVRLAYRKSVEVRPGELDVRDRLLQLMPFGKSQTSTQSQERWQQLLQQPDVAKFTIALVFRNALASDGVHLKFCDQRLDEEALAA